MNNFMEWLFKPFTEVFDEQNTTTKKIVVAKNTTKFRPTDFTQYIGQQRVKRILANYIEGTRKRNTIFPHTLISGGAGHGKTTLSQIVAVELQVPYMYSIGSNIRNYEDIIHRVECINGGILMLDEIHSLPRELAEKFYPMMEDFRDCSPFTLIGATTELGEILKDRKPFYDRFKIILELERYTFEDLVRMASLYKNQLFENESIITKETYAILALNCRGNPRHLIRLLEATVYFNGNISAVLDSFSIIENGITVNDLKVLTYLEMNERGVGIGNICTYLDTSYENYLYQIEPFLIINGMLIRTKQGRKITEKGKQILNKLGRV